MKETYENHVMGIILFEETDIYTGFEGSNDGKGDNSTSVSSVSDS